MKHAAILLFAAVCACGPAVRSGSTPIFQEPAAPPSPSFATRDRGRQNLLNDLASQDVTPARNLPFSGTLHYDGHLNAALGSQTDVIGDLSVSVDLGREEISGAAGNFTDRYNRDYAGQLSLFNGTFNESPRADAYQTRAGVRGTLTDPAANTFAVAGQLEGDVLGQNAQGFEAVLNGAVKINGGSQQTMRGGAVAVRR